MPSGAAKKPAQVELPELGFTDREAFRAWLVEHHASERGLWLLFDKKHTGRETLRYEGALREALCFGWIDSTVRRVDDERYAQKFTPRRPGARWSASNIARVKELIAAGLMTEAGLAKLGQVDLDAPPAAVELGQEVPVELSRALEDAPKAAAAFAGLSPGHRRRYVAWVGAAKKAETRERRSAEAVRLLGEGVKALLK